MCSTRDFEECAEKLGIFVRIAKENIKSPQYNLVSCVVELTKAVIDSLIILPNCYNLWNRGDPSGLSTCFSREVKQIEGSYFLLPIVTKK